MQEIDPQGKAHRINDLGFKFIIDSYNEQGLFSRFFIDPSAIPPGQREQAVMGLLDRVSSLAEQPALLPRIQAALRKNGQQLTLGALTPIVEAAAPILDQESIAVFGQIAKGFPHAKKFLQSQEIALLDNAEKAARIYSWLNANENKALFGMLTHLNLPDLNLTIVPQRMLELFTNLQMIDLSKNDITSMPDLRLPNLRRLFLGGNKLTSLPDFGHLPNLELLALPFNQLTKVPSFSHLPLLQKLYLKDNLLEEAPDCGHLEMLQELDLSDNPLKSRPLSYKQLLDRGCEILGI